jgi:DNA-binding NtrC family response regulator
MLQRTTLRDVLYVNPQPSCLGLFPTLRASGWEPHAVTTPEQFRRLTRSRECNVGILRLEKNQSDLETFPNLSELLGEQNREWVALLTKEAVNDPEVRRLIAECFFDFHTLPLSPGHMMTTLGHAYGMASMKRLDLEKSLGKLEEAEMVGCSPVMLALFRNIRKVAGTDAAVFITGETGTGKELTAQAIHERSSRAGGPFVTINCGAIPSSLIQSELFGYEKGAFTGAMQRKIGRIESASGGTIFLDEIGDLPMDLQANLLRFLQEKQIDRVGGKDPVTVDVRVIAATHVDLEKAVAEGRFRQDLYHRLNVLGLRIPSLRERGGDIEVLARHFFTQFSDGRRRSLRGFSREAMEAMIKHDWPGNVRELINRVRRAAVMCEGRTISSRDMGFEAVSARHQILTLDEARNQAEQQAILSAMNRNVNNLARTARDLGVSRVTLYRLIDKHQLRGHTAE